MTSYKVKYKKDAKKFLLKNKKIGLKFHKIFDDISKNIENVEYRGELQTLAITKLGLKIGVDIEFLIDISDLQRTELFQNSLCVVYTPNNEHFGIVPIEAMYLQTPVIAVNTGGPLETIVDGITGYLKSNTSIEFATALMELYQNPNLATKMGKQGKIHVISKFGLQRFESEWNKLIVSTINNKGKKQKQQQQNSSLILWCNTFMYLMEALLALFVVLVLTWILRYVGILSSSQSIVGSVRQYISGNEDEL